MKRDVRYAVVNCSLVALAISVLWFFLYQLIEALGELGIAS